MNTYEDVKSEYIKWSGKEYQYNNLESQENIILFALHYHKSKIQNIENEIVFLDAPEVKHVGLLDVRGSDASEVKETSIEQTSGAAFREMIDSGNGCDYCLGALVLPVYTKHGMRTIDCFCQSQTMKES